MILESFRYRLRRKLATKLLARPLSRLAGAGRAGPAARLMQSQIVTLSEARNPAEAVTALMLPKPGFSEDIMASLCRDGRFRVLALDRTYSKIVFGAFLPLAVDDNNYRSAPAQWDDAKAELRRFWADAWPLLGQGIDVVVTGNFSYCAEQEMTAALEAQGTPLVALHKECLKSPALEGFYERVYRQRKIPFQGRRVATYNAIERDIQVRAGTVAADRVAVTGMARLDRIHAWRQEFEGARRRTGARPRVLFMSFNPRTGVPMISRKLPQRREILDDSLEAVNWEDLVRQCHAAMVHLAERAPDIDVVIKTKDHARALEVLEQSFGRGFKPPSNLEFVVGGDPFAQIIAADVLCGFNSTSLFEALATNVPIVLPLFAEAAAPASQGYVVDLGRAAGRASSADELVERLAEGARAKHAAGHATVLAEAQSEALEHWLGNADGGAGQRVADLVHEVVKGP
ncbi:MAG TPA: hypothetical protein QF861_08130 [Alphaproteobacteria bacterium]|nr:hypothetical protein [Alphaproteobacteria bacterium]